MPMNKLSIVALVTAVIAIILAGYALMLIGQHAQKALGASNPNCVSGTVTCYTDLLISGVRYLGAQTLAGSLAETSSEGTCSTATSSQAIITNPFLATSTASVELLVLGPNATSTTVTVGTTTLTSGLTSTNPGLSLVASALQATATQAVIVSGQTLGIGSGQVSAGSGSVGKVIVGPGESIGIYGTSTYGNAGALNYTPSTCNYKILWRD